MSLDLSLEGRAALVTGGSRSIGKAVALMLARAGADVMVGAAARKQDALDVARTIEGMGRRGDTVIGDLGAPETAVTYVDACRDRFGRLDILVNNAGIWEESSIADLTPEFLERTLSINLKSAFHLCRSAVPLLEASPAGRIINISSTASLMGEPHHSPYAASKGALDALTRSLAVELGPSRITVNSVAPGWTRTEMTEAELATERGRELVATIPLRKVAEADDVAYAVLYLASDWAGHVTGVTLPVEGAYRIRR
jgi:3-oxoacyl-[acyl-carrier protein] reductase